ncbi:prepilin-type N-terminal cleavage/methylation domain-containing protein [Silvimonas sp.]|uniref:type II secretion system protein n=1 Tax=Silvimonas sp. TaxID=2650811 RepID=UPI0028487681|nr:prepilin-type N-terminal cleavage/methylation domain-containing protein [Silvimonas sp.]MDR3425906.1 prepilin-type N-terminal cleavage/methylation domain-containing protein [Silvimonas sp.]
MRYSTYRGHSRQAGFTLVEMATVLVIVGLLLGMAFKGKDLIDGARVKSIYASSSKIQTAMQVFFERYQAYPGDGCSSTAKTPAECVGDASNPKDGLILGEAEASQFWSMLIQNSRLLAAADQKMPGGVLWAVAKGEDGKGGTAAGSSWLVAQGLDEKVVDIRYACALDQQFDDGDPTTGEIRSSATGTKDSPTGYSADADCWSKSGSAALSIRLLP